jgi:hypothetical protein
LLELRVVLVMKPLLADLTRRVVVARAESLLEDLSTIVGQLCALHPGVVIVGPSATDSRQIVTVVGSDVRVLTFSPDLTHILGPDPGDATLLTPGVLAKHLRDIAFER